MAPHEGDTCSAHALLVGIATEINTSLIDIRKELSTGSKKMTRHEMRIEALEQRNRDAKTSENETARDWRAAGLALGRELLRYAIIAAIVYGINQCGMHP